MVTTKHLQRMAIPEERHRLEIAGVLCHKVVVVVYDCICRRQEGHARGGGAATRFACSVDTCRCLALLCGTGPETDNHRRVFLSYSIFCTGDWQAVEMAVKVSHHHDNDDTIYSVRSHCMIYNFFSSLMHELKNLYTFQINSKSL